MQPGPVQSHLSTVSYNYLSNQIWHVVWTGCRSVLDVEFLNSNHFSLLCWYILFYFTKSVVLVFNQLSTIRQASPDFVIIHLIRQTAQWNFLMCHFVTNSNSAEEKNVTSVSITLPEPSHGLIIQVIQFPLDCFLQHSWEMKVQRGSKLILSSVGRNQISLSIV